MALPCVHLSPGQRHETAARGQEPDLYKRQPPEAASSPIHRKIKLNEVQDEGRYSPADSIWRPTQKRGTDVDGRAKTLAKRYRRSTLWIASKLGGYLPTSGTCERLSHKTIDPFIYSSQGQELGLYEDLSMAHLVGPASISRLRPAAGFGIPAPRIRFAEYSAHD